MLVQVINRRRIVRESFLRRTSAKERIHESYGICTRFTDSIVRVLVRLNVIMKSAVACFRR